MTEKPRLVEVKDASEIEAVRRDGIDDPIGAFDSLGQCWAYAWSLERYRERVRRADLADVGHS